jgi:uncharacterized protein YjbI with pentapeptide repeats
VFPIETYFAHTAFSEWANFRGAKFAGKLVCFRAVFSSWGDFSCATFREAEFRFAKFERRAAMFDNAVFQGWADFEEAHFF